MGIKSIAIGAVSDNLSRPSVEDGNGDLVFQPNVTEQVRITSGGNAGIWTSSLAAKLDVNGAIKGASFNGTDGGTF